MIVTYKEFNLINFPIFALPSDNLEVIDGLLKCDNRIVDDRNQIGETLGIRRLQTPHKLLPLKKCYEDIPGLIRAKNRVFVDNKGYCFIYERTKFCTVTFHKIVKVSRKNIATVLKISGSNFPIIVKRPPPLGMDWVGMLNFNGLPWVPYEYSENFCTPFRKKI